GAVGIESDHHLRPDATHDVEDARGDLLQRSPPEAAWLLVVRTAHHTAVAVAKGDNFGEANGLRRAVQLRQAQGGGGWIVAQELLLNGANVTIGGADQRRLRPRAHGAGNERTAADLVVRVREANKYALNHAYRSPG